MKITQTAIRDIYEYSKKLYHKQISRGLALQQIYETHKVKKTSSSSYLRNFGHMMRGEKYSRTMNLFATKYYIENIYKDYGYKEFQMSLNALKSHIRYYESLRTVNRKVLRELIADFEAVIPQNKFIVYPSEETLANTKHYEGALKKVLVNKYERNIKARKKCIEHYLCKCIVCEFDFIEKYGEIGKDFIHVHHLIEISSIRKQYILDPIKDLRPVCPNCHAMLHKKKPAYTIPELKNIIQGQI